MVYHTVCNIMAMAALLILGSAFPALAQQEKLPMMDISPGLAQENQAETFTAARPVFNYPNEYLNDILELQYQTTLLQKMILRQGSIVRLENSFISVGVPFDQPAPPRGICEQIPANVPCYQAFPELYPGVVAEVSEIEESLDDLGQVDLDDIPAAPASNQAAAPEPAKPATLETGYKWAEIMCRGGDCSAVVSNGSSRRTVREGDNLEDDLMVKTISSKGVTVTQDGLTEALQSALAPSRGGMASPKFTNTAARGTDQLSGTLEDRASQLQNMLGNRAEENSAEVEPLVNPPANVPRPSDDNNVEDPGPPLGPTGLY